MSRPDYAATWETEVPFHHCDPLFVVWHGRYFEYLEAARSALLERFDCNVKHVRDLGYRMYITDARCRYMYPLSYNDRVGVTAWFSATTPLIRVVYDVTNLTQGRRAARAYTVLATTDNQGALMDTPAELVERLPA